MKIYTIAVILLVLKFILKYKDNNPELPKDNVLNQNPPIQTDNSIFAPIPPGEFHSSPLIHKMAASNNLEMLGKMVKSPFYINLRNSNGHTPLAYAAWTGKFDAVKMLVEAGADVNIADNNSRPPLFYAAMEGHNDIAIYLIKKGANFIVKDRWGFTALHFACKGGCEQLVDFLILNGADVNATSSITTKNWTPLAYAARSGHAKIVKKLLDNGADPNIRTNVWRPVDIAEGYKHQECVQLLRNAIKKEIAIPFTPAELNTAPIDKK